jgi:hypothetical protein
MKKIKIIATVAALILTGVVHAQPGVTVGTDSGEPNDTVTIPISYLGTGSTVVGVQWDVNYGTDLDDTAPDLTGCGGLLGDATISCTDQGGNIRFVGFSGSLSEIPSGSLGNIVFTIDAGATVPSTLPLTVTGELYGDSGGGNIPAVGTVPGSVMVVLGPQPDYASAPVAGTTLNFNGGDGGPAPTATVDITNSGDATSTLTGSCALSGINAASFAIDSGSPFSVLQGTAAATVTVSCSTAVVAVGLTASLDCTHDGSTAPSPASYPLNCDIAAITPQYNSTPAAGTALPLGQILQGGTNPATSIDIDNDNGDATTTLTGTCSIAAPFSVTSGANFSVLQGAAAATVAIDCDATAAPALYNENLSCIHNGSNVASPVTYPVSCEVLAAAASGSQNPANGTALSVVAPPGGSTTTTVAFSEVGGQGVAITDLTCSVTGPDFVITSPLAFPATVPTAGTLPVVVTFTDPAVAGPFTDTLNCTYTDGTGAVAVSYPLNGAVRAVVVPTLGWMGYSIMMLGLLLVGFFGIRRRA